MRLTAVVLAAGASSRLGTAKQLVRFEGESLLRRAARTAVAAGVDETIVVLPPGLFRDELDGLEVTVVENAKRDEGIASSIRAGVGAAGEGRVLLMLCDQPLIDEEHLRNLAVHDEAIVATGYGGGFGVPAIFAPAVRGELLSLTGDRGAKSVIAAHAAECRIVPFEPAAADVDSREDLALLQPRPDARNV